MQELSNLILAGVIGGLAVYYIPKLIKVICLRFKPILIYQFDEDGTGRGQRNIHHSFGIAVQDDDASNRRAWEHNNIKKNDGTATCYGPYTKEIPFRGKYKARFRIKAIGIKNKENPIIVLDVAHGIRNENGIFNMLGAPLVERELKGKNLLKGGYQNFNVKFDCDGQSLIEFRCIMSEPDNYKQYVDRILFDNIKVFQLFDIL